MRRASTSDQISSGLPSQQSWYFSPNHLPVVNFNPRLAQKLSIGEGNTSLCKQRIIFYSQKGSIIRIFSFPSLFIDLELCSRWASVNVHVCCNTFRDWNHLRCSAIHLVFKTIRSLILCTRSQRINQWIVQNAPKNWMNLKSENNIFTFIS